MPPVSEKQRKLFRWAAAHPKEARSRGIKPGVAKVYYQQVARRASGECRVHVERPAQRGQSQRDVGPIDERDRVHDERDGNDV